MEELKFQVAFGAVKHFGRNLYTSNPPAIAELIANSWDAYAKECIIQSCDNNMDSGTHALLMADNGIGMTDEEFQGRYAVSGMRKKIEDIRVPVDMETRPYMGNKGIGKFSAFSLGDEYVLFTKSDKDEQWKKIILKYSQIIVLDPIIKIKIERLSKSDLDEELKTIGFKAPDYDTGTIILIPNLRRKFIKSTEVGTHNIISRRFAIGIAEKYNFSLKINDHTVDLDTHFYYENMEFVHYFGYSKEEIKTIFKNVKEEFLTEYKDDFLENNKVKGWIGSVDKGASLVTDGINSAGIATYINCKIADENTLKAHKNDSIANTYVTGEVNADFLQNKGIDPVLSSREGLNHEIEDVNSLIEALVKARASLIKAWNDNRANREDTKQTYLNKIFEVNKTVKDSYRRFLDNDSKKLYVKLAQKVFDGKEEDYPDELVIAYSNALLSLVNTKKIAQDIDYENNMEQLLSDFADFFKKTEINEALRIKAKLQDRYNILHKLKDCISEDAVEKIFEDHLFENPWLIEPYWDVKNVVVERQKHYKSIISNNKETKENILDIVVSVSEENFPIIVELKRSKKTNYSAPTPEKIVSQIYRYRSALKQEIFGSQGLENINDIKAYFICGVEAHKKIISEGIDHLRQNNVIVVTYEEIIAKAAKIYHTDLLDSKYKD